MHSLDLHSCEMGTISSRSDGAVTIRLTTAELRPSEAGALLQYHGKACRVAIFPHEGEVEKNIEVKTERGEKTPSERLRAIIFAHWKESQSTLDFPTFYLRRMEAICEGYKSKNLDT